MDNIEIDIRNNCDKLTDRESNSMDSFTFQSIKVNCESIPLPGKWTVDVAYNEKDVEEYKRKNVLDKVGRH